MVFVVKLALSTEINGDYIFNLIEGPQEPREKKGCGFGWFDRFKKVRMRI